MWGVHRGGGHGSLFEGIIFSIYKQSLKKVKKIIIIIMTYLRLETNHASRLEPLFSSLDAWKRSGVVLVRVIYTLVFVHYVPSDGKGS